MHAKWTNEKEQGSEQHKQVSKRQKETLNANPLNIQIHVQVYVYVYIRIATD